MVSWLEAFLMVLFVAALTDAATRARHQARDELVSTGFIGCREGRVGNSQKFCETIYARVAERVLGSTPGVVDGAAQCVTI
jgi:hypothetical protein